MSTTGHYTRYINQYPGWSDNCDTMYKSVTVPTLLKRCESCHPEKCSVLTNGHKSIYCKSEFGYFQVENNIGNTWSYCEFRWHNEKHNYWHWRKEQTDYLGPFRSGGSVDLIDYKGKKAIQYVLEQTEKIIISDLVDIIFKTEFYNRSYADYFRFYLTEVDINV
jgi:hypothetical protein